MASKKKAAKRSGARKRRGGPNKSAFIRQYPDAPAADVVAKGKAAGLSFSPAFVYAIRSKSRKGGATKAGPGRPAAAAGGAMTASDFVRSLPATMKAKDVVLAGKAKGIKVSPNLVYMVRSAARKGGGRKSARGAGAPVRAQGDVAVFKRLALSLGVSTARRALDDLERGLAALLGN